MDKATLLHARLLHEDAKKKKKKGSKVLSLKKLSTKNVLMLGKGCHDITIMSVPVLRISSKALNNSRKSCINK